MKTNSPQKPRVYFDGLCRLCSREIEHYQRQTGSENLEFVDITRPGFNASNEGVDEFAVHKIMHVRRADGTLATKIDAFIEIWSNLPRYQWAARYAKNALAHGLLSKFYDVFAIIRPYLPRKKALCEESPFCEIKQKA